MLLEDILIDRRSRIPPRHQLARQLELRILGGHLRPGRRLPSVRRVSELLGLHRNTVAAAYRDLVGSGVARSRPGSGVYVRRAGASEARVAARVAPRGTGDFELSCADEALAAALSAELAARLEARVRRPTDRNGTPGAGDRTADVFLAPSTGFLRQVRALPRPSIVAVISDAEAVHRLVSIAVTVHAGEGVAYLPVSTAPGTGLQRAARLARLLAADYAALPAARRELEHRVTPLSVIAERSFARLRRVTQGCAPQPLARVGSGSLYGASTTPGSTGTMAKQGGSRP